MVKIVEGKSNKAARISVREWNDAQGKYGDDISVSIINNKGFPYSDECNAYILDDLEYFMEYLYCNYIDYTIFHAHADVCD